MAQVTVMMLSLPMYHSKTTAIFNTVQYAAGRLLTLQKWPEKEMLIAFPLDVLS